MKNYEWSKTDLQEIGVFIDLSEEKNEKPLCHFVTPPLKKVRSKRMLKRN